MKLTKKDFIFISIFIVTILIFLFILIGNGYLFGSQLDFDKQHFLFPDYLRQLFYETNDLFPDFMANLGAGQNIYNVAYYGLYNPVYYIAYLFPNLDMLTFIQITMVLTVISSVILFYFYLRKHKFNELVSFLTAFSFLCASPLIFHAHRHIMFVNYLPFLILGFYGVDRYVDKDKPLLLIISSTLMIFTSYFFSVGGLVVLFIYTVYRYLKKKKELKIKKLINYKLKTIIPFAISILISSIIIIPTLYVLLTNRSDSNSTVTFIDMFVPTDFIMDDTYSMGLTLITTALIFYLVIKGKWQDRLLSIIVLLFSFIPIFNYALNGFMYINGKSLIPFIPIALYISAIALNKILKNKDKILKPIIIVIIIISSSLNLISVNTEEEYMTNEDSTNKETTYQEITDYLQEYDQSFYKTNITNNDLTTINQINNIDEYKNTLYSSTSNSNYQNFYSNTLTSNVEYRNQFVINATSNLLGQIYMNEKYIVTDNLLNDKYYTFLTKINGNNIYLNNNVLPIGYATNNNINIDEYNELNDFDKTINLIGRTITEQETTATIINSNLLDNNLEVIESNNIKVEGNIIESEKDGYLKLKVNALNYEELLFLSFDLTPQDTDLQIEVNNIINKLTDQDWKYYNNNTTFEYLLTDYQYLEIYFTEGTYEIVDVELRSIELNNIISDLSIEKFIVDQDETKGDVISGQIEVKEDTNFVLNIPYEENYLIKVNNQEIDYSIVNQAFVGFDLEEGLNQITIEYKAPLKEISLILSIIGIISLIIYLIYKKTK